MRKSTTIRHITSRMARPHRFAPAGLPVHATQRGNYRQDVFRTDSDRDHYLELLARHAAERSVHILGYCLMTNHIHLIAIPGQDEALSLMMQCLQSEYAISLNQRQGQRGHLWQGRFHSCVVEHERLWTALRYVELNPVRAGISVQATHYKWSSAKFHCGLEIAPDWLDMLNFGAAFTEEQWQISLEERMRQDELAPLRMSTRLGRPWGGEEFVEHLESAYKTKLKVGRVGRPRQRVEFAA